MNRSHDPAQFDARMRRLHATALTTLPPETLAQLRQARHAAAAQRSRRLHWLLATACSALLAVGIGVQLRPTEQAPATTTTQVATTTPAATTADTDDLLTQNPDLFVWLGSDTALAME
ncbi:hypothetical protein SIL81_05720 [Xanthomonas campestris pv. incanae]|uniref:hypothetical protein n=1 Tax=Xanthomonas campestris TaxID=339 RepID=UPI0029C2DD64|nr:hypothetical protein [Xanthomonas campestris]MDX6080141.1 hypothetical protein [Xanthomonas campestris pv. incanae]MDX6087527.1 hypothetical protein [Xanthomonas campestris pv. incanae]MDX6138711.1 hypothetical protein [Xanthomonas campestris pv. incanae]